MQVSLVLNNCHHIQWSKQCWKVYVFPRLEHDGVRLYSGPDYDSVCRSCGNNLLADWQWGNYRYSKQVKLHFQIFLQSHSFAIFFFRKCFLGGNCWRIKIVKFNQRTITFCKFLVEICNFLFPLYQSWRFFLHHYESSVWQPVGCGTFHKREGYLYSRKREWILSDLFLLHSKGFLWSLTNETHSHCAILCHCVLHDR